MRAEAGWILRWTFSCRVEGGEESSLTQRRLIDALSHHAHIAYQTCDNVSDCHRCAHIPIDRVHVRIHVRVEAGLARRGGGTVDRAGVSKTKERGMALGGEVFVLCLSIES